MKKKEYLWKDERERIYMEQLGQIFMMFEMPAWKIEHNDLMLRKVIILPLRVAVAEWSENFRARDLQSIPPRSHSIQMFFPSLNREKSTKANWKHQTKFTQEENRKHVAKGKLEKFFKSFLKIIECQS